MNAPAPGTPARRAGDRAVVWGVLGILLAVGCPVLGVVFGSLSMQEARRGRRSPVPGVIAIALSLAALAVGSVLLLTRSVVRP